jgi:NAD(P)-dependent dehydrogenase (short-subunit alcohol dehydrogenase family)
MATTSHDAGPFADEVAEPGAGPFAGSGALITGGGSGIGFAAARFLARDGAQVTLMGRTADKLGAAAAELAAEFPTAPPATIAPGSVDDEDAVAEAVRIATEATGRLSVAVASAGTGGVAPILAQPLDEFQSIVSTNLVGTFLTIKHAGRAIVAGGGGSIVAVSSLAACTVHAWMAAYAATKAGIDALVRNAADELGPSGVRVNSVQPSLVDTELVAYPMADEPLVESYLVNMPVAHIGQPDEVAQVIRFLAGDESSWMTGNCLPVDGGHHLRRGPDYGSIAALLYGDDAVLPGFTGPTAD